MPVSSTVCMDCIPVLMKQSLLFSTFSYCSATYRNCSAAFRLKTVLSKTTHRAMLVWACCLKCSWDTEIRSSKSSWRNWLLHLKADQTNTVLMLQPCLLHVRHVCVHTPLKTVWMWPCVSATTTAVHGRRARKIWISLTDDPPVEKSSELNHKSTTEQETAGGATVVMCISS